MDGKVLSQLMTERYRLLNELLELSRRQSDAIQQGRMSDLMKILSAKQRPINRLLTLAKQIGQAAGDDPHSRHWRCEQDRVACRQQQQQCEHLHLELLAIEADCETLLKNSRGALQQQISQLDASHRAAKSYLPIAAAPSTGNRLDLSE